MDTAITRKELERFLDDPRTIRAFEELFAAIGIDDEFKARVLAMLSFLQMAPPMQQNNSLEIDYIDLPITGPHVPKERRIQWNPDDGTLDIGLYNGVVLQCGQELHYYGKNTSAETIPDGGSVMATGTLGNSGKLTIAKAVADGSVLAKYMLGIATQEILPGAFGYVTAFGLVRGIDTSAYVDGDVLYFNPAVPGGLTKIRPIAPQFSPSIAIVINAHRSGSIFVRMTNGVYMYDLQDAHIVSLANNEVMHYVAVNNRWENTSILQGLKFGTATDYSTFENDGTLVAIGAATTWRDIDFPIIVRTIGPNIPTLTTMQGNITAPQWAVNDYNVCEGQELIHEWKEGTTLLFHIHIITNGLDATTRYTRWEVEWCWANLNGVLSASGILDSGDVAIPANTTSKTHLTIQISTVLLSSGKIAGHVWARLKRVTATGAAPTNNPWCSMLQMHVECDTMGSRGVSTK